MTRDDGPPGTTWPRLGPGPRGARSGPTELEVTVAFLVSFAMAFRLRLRLDIPFGYVVAAALLPVTVATLWRYRGALPIALLSAGAAVSGIVLTASAASYGPVDNHLAIMHTALVLGLGLAMMSLLWARSVIGIRNTVFAYGLGMLASVALVGVNHDNPWKFSFSVPVVLLVLSLPKVYGNRAVESVLLLVLAGYSALSDSRSAAATMLIAALLVLTQGLRSRSPRSRPRGRSSRILLRVVVIVLAAAYLLQQAIIEGTLGSSAQERTIQQIDTSGSLLLGGRPEIGATAALLKDQPWGYGAGTLANHHNFQKALGGMTRLGFDPDSRYVQTYMLDRGFEVHSLVGDLWIVYGLVGLALALVLGLYIVYGIARSIGNRVASGVLLYLALRSTWDLAFSPINSALETLPLTLAVILAVIPEGGSPPGRWLRSRR
jgi:hypothetical protein